MNKSLIGYSFDTLCQAFLSFFVLAIAARVTDLKEFGVLVFVMAIAGVQQPISACGAQQIIYGRVALWPKRKPRLNASAVAIAIFMSVIIYLGTILCMIIYGSPLYSVLYCLAGLRVLGAIALPVISDAQARHAIKEFLPIRVVTFSVAVLMAVYAWVNIESIEIFALIWGGESFLFAILIMISAKLKKRIGSFKKNKLKKLALVSSPIAGQSILIAIYYRFDQFYVQFKFGVEELAIYASAARIAELGNVVSSVLALFIAPYFISELYSRGKMHSAIWIGALGVFLASLLISALLFLFGEQLLMLIFGADFAVGSDILSVYFLSTAFVAYGAIASKALSAKSKTQIQMVSGLVGVITIVISAVILCEILGSIGAAWATVIAYAASSAVLVIRIVSIRKTSL